MNVPRHSARSFMVAEAVTGLRGYLVRVLECTTSGTIPTEA